MVWGVVGFFSGIFNVSNSFYNKNSLLTSGIYFVDEVFPLAISLGNGVLPGTRLRCKAVCKIICTCIPAKSFWLPYASSNLQGYVIVLNTQTDGSPYINSDTFCFPQHAGYIWLGIRIHYPYQTQLATSYILVRSLFYDLQASCVPSVYLEFKIN